MFNASRLVTARKRRGLTLTALAAETGISRATISALENARNDDPSDETVAALARRLEVHPNFFLGDDLDEIPIDAVSFRALSKMTARTRDRGLAAGRVALLLNDWIEDRFNLPPADLPTLSRRPPQIAAEELRARWGLGERPIGNMVHLLEAHGVRVYSLTDDTKALDAYCLYWHGRPFVFVSQAKSAERHRFNAAHELGHLVMHNEDEAPHGPEAEAEANQFAAAFLMPRSSVLAQGLTNATTERFLVAKKKWSVAAMAMAHRANELGLMTEWAYRTVCVDLSRLGYRRGEPYGIPHESSQLLTKVFQQLRSQGESVATIARDLGLPADDIQGYLLGLTPTSIDGDMPSSSSERRTDVAPRLSIVRDVI